MKKLSIPPLRNIGRDDTVHELFQKNLAAMRVWYRKAATPGPEVGANIIHELVLANVMTALDYALQGKDWVAPRENP